MTTVVKKLTTACQYATTLERYPFLWRKTVGAMLGAPASLENTAPQAMRWCLSKAVSNEQALATLANATSRGTFESRFPDEIASARREVESCPQQMGGGANLTLLHDLVIATGATRIIETGVAYGWSSLAILLALRSSPGSRLVSTNLHYREFESDRARGLRSSGGAEEELDDHSKVRRRGDPGSTGDVPEWHRPVPLRQ